VAGSRAHSPRIRLVLSLEIDERYVQKQIGWRG
jgi:hypothetical protein